MNAPYNQDVLAAAEACFAQASQLLYCEPDAEVVADQVAERLVRALPVDLLCIAGGLVLRFCVVWSGMH